MLSQFINTIKQRIICNNFFKKSYISQGLIKLSYLDNDEHKGISFITLNRPELKNALSKAMINELRYCIQKINQNQYIRCIIIKSAIKDVFSSGADLKERLNMSIDETREIVDTLRETFDQISKLKIPTIALIQGIAFGGGAELALACDFRIGSKNMLFSLPEVKLGIIPGAGGTQRLSRIIGLSKAKELILTGKRINAEEALNLGLINILDNEHSEQKAIDMCYMMINGGPIALHMAKKAIENGYDVDMNNALKIEKQCYELVLKSSDRIEGLMSFKEKRNPNFKGK